jgi:hypothetical protein
MLDGSSGEPAKHIIIRQLLKGVDGGTPRRAGANQKTPAVEVLRVILEPIFSAGLQSA